MMPANIHYIIQPALLESLVQHGKGMHNNPLFLLEIPATGSWDSNTIFLQLENIPGRLSLHVPENYQLAETMRNDLLALSFLPLYLKWENSPVIFTKASILNGEVSQLNELFIQAGYAGAEIVSEFILFEKPDSILYLRGKEWLDAMLLDQHWLLRINTMEEFVDSLSAVNTKQGELLKDHGEFMPLLDKLYIYRQDLRQARNETVKYRLRSQVMEEFLITHAKNGEAARIQQFYDREYEVLPRWYKQFGHLIKLVSRRKRTGLHKEILLKTSNDR